MQITLMGAGFNPVKLFDASQHRGKKYGLIFQVVSNIKVWLSTNPTELQQLDKAGNPMGGIEFDGGAAPTTPVLFTQFADQVWAVSSAQGAVNVVPYLREV